MARTPSMTVEQAVTAIGSLPGHPFTCTSENRNLVKKWLVAQGLWSTFVHNLSLADMGEAYTKPETILPALRRREAAYKTACERNAAAKGKTFTFENDDDDSDDNETETETVTVPAAPKANGHGGDDMGRLRELILGGWTPPAATLDESAVKAIVAKAIEGLNQVHRVEIIERGETRAIEGTVHPSFPKLLKMSQCRRPDGHYESIWLSGEASSGKTTACKMLAKALDRRWYFNGAISQPHEMLGFIDAAGHYHRTPFRDAYEHGGVYTFDEVDRSDPVALLAVNPHLANGVAAFPDGMIERHPDCLITATGNTWGGGATAEYVGATKLDAAFMSRFPMRLAWNIDTAFERTIVANDAWCTRVQKARAAAQAAGLKVLIDTRIAIAGAALIACGHTSDEAAEITYLANVTADQRRIIER